jgi:endonuclease/exonuclease/phosphatase family metal-dependent hydrolase
MKSTLLVSILLLSACSDEVGASAPWIAWQDIPGALRPEVAAPPEPTVARGTDAALRVVTFNVETGRDVEALARAFQDDAELARADVVLVQEIENHPGEGGGRAERLAARLGMGYAYAPERLSGDGTHGLAILSVLPLENVEVMVLPHMEVAWTERHRIALAADVRHGDQVIHLVTVHLDTRLNIDKRILQLRPAVIDAPPCTIVGGDFNTNPYVWADNSIPQLPVDSIVGPDHQALVLDDYMRHIGFATPTAKLGTTNHTAVIDTRLDSIYARDLHVVPGEVEREIGLSDHWPLWVDVL